MKEGLEKGLKEGMEKGLKEGSANQRLQFVHNMLRTGFSLDDIAKATGMSKEDVKNLC